MNFHMLLTVHIFVYFRATLFVSIFQLNFRATLSVSNFSFELQSNFEELEHDMKNFQIYVKKISNDFGSRGNEIWLCMFMLVPCFFSYCMVILRKLQ